MHNAGVVQTSLRTNLRLQILKTNRAKLKKKRKIRETDDRLRYVKY